MKKLLLTLLLAISLMPFSSCYSYRIATRNQEGSEITRVTAHSWFWGLVQKPKQLSTPNCDSLNIYGMSEVQVKTNLGYALVTVVSLGIYCPVKVEYRCGKPCPKNGRL